MAGLFAVLALSLPAQAMAIKGHKDDLFALPKILSQSSDGGFVAVDYDEMRDINGRDETPELRVRGRYVDLGVRRQSRMRDFAFAGRRVEIGEAGRFEGGRFAVVFIHGRGGDRRLGMNDFRFGGNFNRLKNLAVKNGGVYIAPSVREFGPSGVADVAAVIDGFRSVSGDAPVILACGSMGSMICLEFARDAALSARLAGMVLLGAIPDPGLAVSPLARRGVPVDFVHGSRDSVYDWQAQRSVYDAMRRKAPRTPARFVLLESGSHGSPIRMVDWKDVLSRMLAPY